MRCYFAVKIHSQICKGSYENNVYLPTLYFRIKRQKYSFRTHKIISSFHVSHGSWQTSSHWTRRYLYLIISCISDQQNNTKQTWTDMIFSKKKVQRGTFCSAWKLKNEWLAAYKVLLRRAMKFFFMYMQRLFWTVMTICIQMKRLFILNKLTEYKSKIL